MIQGSQASFLTPIIAMMELPKWRSPETLSPGQFNIKYFIFICLQQFRRHSDESNII